MHPTEVRWGTGEVDDTAERVEDRSAPEIVVNVSPDRQFLQHPQEVVPEADNVVDRPISHFTQPIAHLNLAAHTVGSDQVGAQPGKQLWCEIAVDLEPPRRSHCGAKPAEIHNPSPEKRSRIDGARQRERYIRFSS